MARVRAADSTGTEALMATFKVSQIINRPVEEVFQTAIHLENFPKWNPARNPSARRVSGGEIGEGSKFELEIKGFGMVPQTLEEFRKNKQVRVVPHIKQIAGGHRFIFTDLGDLLTRIDLELEMIPKGIFKLMTPILLATGKKSFLATIAAFQKHLDGTDAVFF